jgi:hypothetical protein
MFNWIIQHIIGNIPVYVWAFVAGAGAGIHFITVFLARIPQVKPYSMFIRFISMIATWFGIFMLGGAGVTAVWQEQLKLADEKIKIAEEQSKEANSKIVTKVVKQTEYIKIRAEGFQTEIQQNKEVLDKDCRIPNEFVTIHNKAAEPVK